MNGPMDSPNWTTLLRIIALLVIAAFVLLNIKGLWLTAVITAAVFAGLVLLWQVRS